MEDVEITDNAARRQQERSGILSTAAVVVGAVALLALAGCERSSVDAQGRSLGARAIPVAATPVRTRDVSVYLTGLGSVTPINTVTVKGRIDGQLMRLAFQEGQLVKDGERPDERERS